MLRQHAVRLWLALTAAIMLIPALASAQSNEETFQQFQWNFGTPGARANAMGRAFIGLADDASATVTNPAGLISLTRPQVYVEFKQSQLRTDRLAAVDSFVTGDTRRFSSSIGTVPFFDVAVPLGAHFAAGFSRHEFLRHRETFNLDARFIPPNFFAFPVDARTSFSAASWGGSIAAALGAYVDVGATLSINTFDAESHLTRFRTSGTGFGLMKTSVIANATEIDDSDAAFGWSVGARIKPAPEVSIGLVYTRAPEFSVEEQFYVNLDGSPANQLVDLFVEDITVHVPDRLGAGVAFRPHPRGLVSVDVVRLTYSNLTDELFPIVNFFDLDGSEFSIPDVTEVHIGGEWLVLPGTTRVFIRGGLFRDPAHAMRYTGGARTAGTHVLMENFFNVSQPEGRTVGTVGGGVAHGPHVQFDLAYVWRQELVASVAVRF